MDWQREGSSWPHHERSRFVTAAGQRWHLQQWPAPTAHAPTLLRVQRLLPAAAAGSLTSLAGLGHLAHEEQPQRTADLLLKLLRETPNSVR